MKSEMLKEVTSNEKVEHIGNQYITRKEKQRQK